MPPADQLQRAFGLSVRAASRIAACGLLILLQRSPAAAQSFTLSGTPFAVDSLMTPAGGADTLVAAQHALGSIEDRFIPLKLGSEQTRPGLARGILYRTGKLLMLDVPQDHMLLVVAHEVFGHGARFRELGDGRIRYGFEAPIPYGEGGAVTRFNGEFPVTPIALLAVQMSGIEAQHALADAIARSALQRGRLHYRESWLYFESRLLALTYILSARPFSAEGHDVAQFLDTFQEACPAPQCTALTRKRIQRAALLTLGDPLLYFSIYGFTASYIGQGLAFSSTPMIPLGSALRFLPALGFHLTPYGTEWEARSTFLKGRGMRAEGREQKAEGRGRRDEERGFNTIETTVRVGTTGASTPWSVSLRASDVARVRGIRIGGSASLWRQPALNSDVTSSPLRTGSSLIVTGIVPLPRFLRSARLGDAHMSAGWKAAGFAPGERLGGGPILRAGASLHLP